MSEKNRTGVKIDIKKVIETINKNNPDKKELTQAKLAQDMGLSDATLRNYNNFNAPVVVSDVLHLAKISKLKVNDFIIVENK